MKKPLIWGLILIILAGGILFFWPFSQLEFPEAEITPPKIAKLAEKKVSVPPPLRAEEKKEVPQALLSQQGVIEWTNIQREKYGLSPLKANPKLNATAQAKVEDMFKYQYFAHQSPSGEEVGDLAKKFDYKFLTIGENLALGNFAGDKDLVEAWMASPGHRANILNSSYQEIGVAVGKGIFEGKTTWLAVQYFGLPFSACPQPDLSFKEKINENQTRILEFQSELSSLKEEILKMRPKRGIEYIQAIEQYNALISQYNVFVEGNKTLINEYNSQVDLFNKCVAEFAE